MAPNEFLKKPWSHKTICPHHSNWAILIKILSKNNEDLMYLLNNDIQRIKGVSRTETFISLDQQINRQITL